MFGSLLIPKSLVKFQNIVEYKKNSQRFHHDGQQSTDKPSTSNRKGSFGSLGVLMIQLIKLKYVRTTTMSRIITN